MPTYLFRDKESGEEFSVFMHLSEREQFLAEHPEFEVLPTCASFISSYNAKPSKEFREFLSNVKKKNPGSKVNDHGG